MKKIIPLIILLLGVLSSCDEGINEAQNSSLLILKSTTSGGCNGEDFTEIKALSEDPDTIIFQHGVPELSVSVGLNYICCAGFVTEVSIDSAYLLITLNDTCSDPYDFCYCRCMCYYTWEFEFDDYDGNPLDYQVILNDPREEESIILEEGTYDFFSRI